LVIAQLTRRYAKSEQAIYEKISFFHAMHDCFFISQRPKSFSTVSPSTKDAAASDTLYVEALAAPDTIDTIPEKNLLAFADRGELKGVMTTEGNVEAILAHFAEAGIDIHALALQLQDEGAQAFVKSWQQLLQRIAEKGSALAQDA
jgi:transaldolase